MIGNVVLPGTKKEEWPGIRDALKTRILETFGMPRQGSAQEPGVPEKRPKPEWKELGRAEKHGLTRVTLKYLVMEDHWNEAILIFPGGGEPKSKAPIDAIVSCTSLLHTGDVKYTPTEGTPSLRKAIIRPKVSLQTSCRRAKMP